jgi:hypothetical protein
MRRLRGLTTARKQHPDRCELQVLLLESSARRALAEVLAYRDILAPVPARLTLGARARTWLVALARCLDRLLGHTAALSPWEAHHGQPWL